MPPIPKFTREEIVDAALNVVREEGMEALTARAVACRLGCSTSPIFTIYQDMDELKADVYDAALKLFYAFMADCRNYLPPFKQQGMISFKFAKEEPNLFKLAHMGWYNKPKDIRELYEEMLNADSMIIDRIQKEYGLGNREEADFLYGRLWTYTFAFASLTANGQCSFTENEIVEGLGIEFMAVLDYIKSGKYKIKTVRPTKNVKEKKPD